MYCMDPEFWADDMLPLVEMQIVDYCNLRCKGCTHFSPIFNSKLPDLKKWTVDVRMLNLMTLYNKKGV